VNAIERLKAMESAATPGPWAIATTEEWKNGLDFFHGPSGAFCFPVDIDPEDARLLSAQRNLFPEILAVLEAVDELEPEPVDAPVSHPRFRLWQAQKAFHARAAEVLGGRSHE
jgi:hypothetical protein